MLLQPLTHPPLLGALASAGHGSKVLIADSNYPVASAANSRAQIIYLNLRPGLVDGPSVLEAILTAVPIESATVMSPTEGDPAVFAHYSALLPSLTFNRLARPEFYVEAGGPDTVIVIATGETSHYGNLLLTIGVVPMEVQA